MEKILDKLKLEVNIDEEGMRIDKLLSLKMKDVSRSHIQNIIDGKNVSINDKAVKSSYKAKDGDIITVTIPEAVELSVEPQDIKINIIYEDNDVIVVDKEQGMVVHPAPGNYSGTLVNALLYHCKDLSGINGIIRPGIVHRIDKDTSGILVIAKNDFAHTKLAEQFKEHSINREYIALVEGSMKTEEGTIDQPLGRNPRDRMKYAVVRDGKRAVTHYKLIENYSQNALVKCKLETGRTHQIRVHMAFIHHPLVGDLVYGFKKQKIKGNGQYLHAARLGFIHPTKGEYMEFNSELPDYFKKEIEKLREEK